MKKTFTRSMILFICILTSSLMFGQEYGDLSAATTDRSNCDSKGNLAKVDFEPDQDGEQTFIVVVCGSDLSGPANQACLNKLGSDNLTGDDFKCGPCEIPNACKMSMDELYKGNDTSGNQYSGASPNPTPAGSFSVLGIQFCIHEVGCKTYPGESKWKAKFDCSACEWPKVIEEKELKVLNFPKEEIAAMKEGYNIFPNPTQGHLDLMITDVEFEKSLSFIIFDQSGKLIFEKELQSSNQSDIEEQMDLNGLNSGLYYYTIVVDGLVLPAKKLSVTK